MKILMVAMPTLHFFRWTDQLKDSGHDVYWFDITGMSKPVDKINWVQQHVDWKLKWDFPGRSFLKKHFRKTYHIIQKFNEKDTVSVFEKYLLTIQPDVVHSFALYVSCAPILSVMENHNHIKWIYSSWGSDLFYFQHEPMYLKDIKNVLRRMDYLFTDCKRDYEIATQYGFKGKFLGVFPGGGGFDLVQMERYKKPIEERKTILIKGFQGRSGRAIPVLKAIEKLGSALEHYNVVVFGTDSEAFAYIASTELTTWRNFKAFGKISHQEVLELMGKALIYIGNSNSDGMPNTMLEAICMGAFPIQSNPGGATAELIQDGFNGLLIEDCEDTTLIQGLLLKSLKIDFSKINNSVLISNLDINLIGNSVRGIYKSICYD
jgi:glycosyltransferase involved in cell wall biosynthesis